MKLGLYRAEQKAMFRKREKKKGDEPSRFSLQWAESKEHSLENFLSQICFELANSPSLRGEVRADRLENHVAVQQEC
jgi:hypothetical protein